MTTRTEVAIIITERIRALDPEACGAIVAAAVAVARAMVEDADIGIIIIEIEKTN